METPISHAIIKLALFKVAQTAYERQVLPKKYYQYRPIVEKVLESTKAPFSPEEILGIIATESAFRPRAKSKAGALGLMQVKPETAREALKMSFEPKQLFDPELNIEAGVRYLTSLMEKYKIPRSLLYEAYNVGPSAIKKGKRNPKYSQRVKKYTDFFKILHSQEAMLPK